MPLPPGKELLTQPDIDGALVGGASLKVDDFAGIIDNCGAMYSFAAKIFVAKLAIAGFITIF